MELIDLASANLASDQGCPKSRRYALAYIVWIIQQMEGTSLWIICPTDELAALYSRVTYTLA